MARKRKREPEIPIKEQEGPDWAGFGKALVPAYLRLKSKRAAAKRGEVTCEMGSSAAAKQNQDRIP